MSHWNLERRMLAAALVWLVLAWGLGGTALALVFRGAVLDRFDSKLEALLESLASGVERSASGALTVTRAHPNFAAPSAGWYWLVDDGRQRTTSAPADELQAFPLPPIPLAGTSMSEGPGPNGTRLRAASRAVPLEGGGRAVLAVALDRSEVDREIRSFASLLVAAALGLGVVLLVGILAQTRFALAPLRRLRGDLVEVEAGRLEAVPEAYPPDIVPVAEAINKVLERDQALAAWARKSAGNLAHALKTELALLRQLARDGASGSALVTATDRIAGIVDHHLSRATVGPASGSRARGDTQAVVTAIANSLARIFADHALAIHLDLADALDFRGEVQDLEEIAGNLMENACRHAATEVRVRVFAEAGRLVLLVEDDGPGLLPEERVRATARGERLDEKGPGAGLGLAIVSDLAELYGGRLDLGTSELGGLAARVELPAVAG